MDQFEPYRSRSVHPLPILKSNGWTLKRYAVLAQGRSFDNNIVKAASAETLSRLPDAGALRDETGNHGVGFQIIHFAQVAVVSSAFYWRWGSVLANINQIRASWDTPEQFGDGISDVVGCVWEMEVVRFELAAWTANLLGHSGTMDERLAAYLDGTAL